MALRSVRISKVYYGCDNPRFGGCGSVYTLNHSREVIHDDDKKVIDNDDVSDSYGDDGSYSYEAVGGIRADEAIKLLRDFYALGNPNAPPSKRHRPLATTRPQ